MNAHCGTRSLRYRFLYSQKLRLGAICIKRNLSACIRLDHIFTVALMVAWWACPSVWLAFTCAINESSLRASFKKCLLFTARCGHDSVLGMCLSHTAIT